MDSCVSLKLLIVVMVKRELSTVWSINPEPTLDLLLSTGRSLPAGTDARGETVKLDMEASWTVLWVISMVLLGGPGDPAHEGTQHRDQKVPTLPRSPGARR